MITRQSADVLRLNNWMMIHPQVGPGADATMTPFGVFPPQLQPYAQPFDQNQDPYMGLSAVQQQQQYAPTTKVPQWAVDNPNGIDRNVPSNGLAHQLEQDGRQIYLLGNGLPNHPLGLDYRQ